MKRLLCLLMTTMFLICIVNTHDVDDTLLIHVNGLTTGVLEEKTKCTATIADNFKDDQVILVMTNAESIKFKSYGTSYFSEVSCNHIENITAAKAD